MNTMTNQERINHKIVGNQLSNTAVLYVDCQIISDVHSIVFCKSGLTAIVTLADLSQVKFTLMNSDCEAEHWYEPINYRDYNGWEVCVNAEDIKITW